MMSYSVKQCFLINVWEQLLDHPTNILLPLKQLMKIVLPLEQLMKIVLKNPPTDITIGLLSQLKIIPNLCVWSSTNNL